MNKIISLFLLISFLLFSYGVINYTKFNGTLTEKLDGLYSLIMNAYEKEDILHNVDEIIDIIDETNNYRKKSKDSYQEEILNMMNEINSDISELKKYSSDEVTQSIVSHLLYQTELLRGVNLDIKVLSDMYTEIKIISNIDSLSKYQLIVN